MPTKIATIINEILEGTSFKRNDLSDIFGYSRSFFSKLVNQRRTPESQILLVQKLMAFLRKESNGEAPSAEYTRIQNFVLAKYPPEGATYKRWMADLEEIKGELLLQCSVAEKNIIQKSSKRAKISQDHFPQHLKFSLEPVSLKLAPFGGEASRQTISLPTFSSQFSSDPSLVIAELRKRNIQQNETIAELTRAVNELQEQARELRAEIQRLTELTQAKIPDLTSVDDTEFTAPSSFYENELPENIFGRSHHTLFPPAPSFDLNEWQWGDEEEAEKVYSNGNGNKK